jgi:hypothetical protein
MKFITSLFLISTAIFGQTQYPKDYFRSPLDIPLQLAGNFGELRSNHFHAGFDFRTQQREGFNVYAAAEGYVSRIRISAYGYGKAIYITHPNGFTTVYGHLQRGYGRIETYIKAKQYEKESYDIDVYPAAMDLPVKKGELIGLSGNTGGSEGPHLHFEFRDSKTENIINPLHFGFGDRIPDSKKPGINSIVVYPLEETSVVNGADTPFVINLSPQPNGQYIAQKILAKGPIGFGVNTYDKDNTSGPNGVYQVSSFLNGNPSFDYKFDSFHFDDTRYVNALIDYARYKRTAQRVQKLFMKNKYPLDLIHADANNGIVEVTPNMSGAYRIDITDFNGNKSTVSIPIEYSASAAATPSERTKTPYFIDVTKDYNYEKDGISVFFPAGTFYDNFYLDFDVRDKNLYLSNKLIPAHIPYTISIADTSVPDTLREKTFVALMDGKKVAQYNDTWYKDGVYNSKVKVLGQFALAKDTLVPSISAGKSIEGKWLTKQATLSLFIRDNLSGIKQYKGYLNGKFILFEFDYKSGRITHNFSDGIVAEGKNDLKVVVTDNVGNSATFETQFFRSNK